MARNHKTSVFAQEDQTTDDQAVYGTGEETAGDAPETEATEPEAAEAPAPESVTDEKPEAAHVPLSAGKGGRYTMVDGRRVLRTD